MLLIDNATNGGAKWVVVQQSSIDVAIGPHTSGSCLPSALNSSLTCASQLPLR